MMIIVKQHGYPVKASFPRRRAPVRNNGHPRERGDPLRTESHSFNTLWIPAYARMTLSRCFSAKCLNMYTLCKLVKEIVKKADRAAVIKYVKHLGVGAVVLAYSLSAGAQTLSDALQDDGILALSPGVSGQVAEVLVQPGDQVEKGQLLLTLGATTYQSRFDATKSIQTHALFNLQLLEDDYSRQQELYEEGSLSSVELQQLDLQVKKAGMALALAKAAVGVAAANLAYTRIIAPVGGEISAVPLVGQRVSINAGLPILIKMMPQ